MRYIDADKIIEFINNRFEITWTSNDYEGGIKDACCDILEVVERQPTADVVEVVRCKDCIHCPTMFLTDERTTFTAYGHCFEFGDNDFCSYGERRNND